MAARDLTAQDITAINYAAEELGIMPDVLTAVIGYETMGTFDPDIKGGKGGNYQGLIQFGPPERKAYGYRQGMSFAEQVMGPVVAYLKDRGVKPGHGVAEVYSIINAGSLDKNGNPRWNRSDGNGTVRTHVNRIISQWMPRAGAMLRGERVLMRERRPSYRPEVEALQQVLAAEGFDPGEIDGLFGPATERAVKAYRKANDLGDSGVVDAALAQHMLANARETPLLSDLTQAELEGPDRLGGASGLTVDDITAETYPARPRSSDEIPGRLLADLGPDYLEGMGTGQGLAIEDMTADRYRSRADQIPDPNLRPRADQSQFAGRPDNIGQSFGAPATRVPNPPANPRRDRPLPTAAAVSFENQTGRMSPVDEYRAAAGLAGTATTGGGAPGATAEGTLAAPIDPSQFAGVPDNVGQDFGEPSTRALAGSPGFARQHEAFTADVQEGMLDREERDAIRAAQEEQAYTDLLSGSGRDVAEAEPAPLYPTAGSVYDPSLAEPTRYASSGAGEIFRGRMPAPTLGIDEPPATEATLGLNEPVSGAPQPEPSWWERMDQSVRDWQERQPANLARGLRAASGAVIEGPSGLTDLADMLDNEPAERQTAMDEWRAAAGLPPRPPSYPSDLPVTKAQDRVPQVGNDAILTTPFGESTAGLPDLTQAPEPSGAAQQAVIDATGAAIEAPAQGYLRPMSYTGEDNALVDYFAEPPQGSSYQATAREIADAPKLPGDIPATSRVGTPPRQTAPTNPPVPGPSPRARAPLAAPSAVQAATGLRPPVAGQGGFLQRGLTRVATASPLGKATGYLARVNQTPSRTIGNNFAQRGQAPYITGSGTPAQFNYGAFTGGGPYSGAVTVQGSDGRTYVQNPGSESFALVA